MEKIKRAFGSGGSKDDEIMYGTPSQVSDQPPQLQTDADTATADKENSGILGPVLSTGDEKPSEQSYGTTTQPTEVPQSSSEPVGEDVQRSTEPVTETVQQPSDTQSKTTETEQEPSKSSKGILGRIFKSGDKKESEQGNEATPEATSSATKEFDSAPPGTRIFNLMNDDLDRASCISIKSGKEGPYAYGADTPVIEPSKVYNATEDQSQGDSNFGRDAAIGGVAATGVAGATYAATRDDENDAERGLQRENHGDDVSQATYTARSYPLTSSAAHTSTPREPQVDSSLDRREPEEQSSTARDTSLAGAGTIIGAGAVGAGALAAQEDKHNDPEVEQATYTDRAVPVGSASGTQEGIAPADAKQEETQPNVGSASELTGHMPGEYPTETGEDPHVPGGFPADSTEEEKPNVGSGAAVPTAMGLGALGAAGGGAYAASKSDDTTTAAEAPKATESDLHPGGSGFPYESSKTAEPAEPASDSNLGRDAAIAGGTAAAVAGAGGLTYAATRGDDKPAEAAPTQKFEDTTAAPTSSTMESKPTEPTTRSVDEKPTAATAPTTEEKAEEQKPEEEDSHLGRDAAIAGGATAAAGAGAAYYATRDDEPEQTEEKKGFFDKLKEKKQERDQKKEEEKAEKEREKAEKERQKEQEKAEKERQKEQERLEKERQKEAEKPEESNVGRDAAIAGTGAAAAGGAAYYATRDDDAEKAEKERQEAEKQRAKDQEKAEKERQKEHEKAEKERQKEHEKAEKEREKHQKEAEKEREKEEKKHEKEMTKEEKKEEERRKKEAWEKENAARLAAYQRGELGPQDVLKDGQEQQPIADKSKEEAVEGGVLATGVIGGGAATYAATRGDEQPTASSSEYKTSTDDQGHNVLHKKSEDSGQSSEKKPSLIQKILHPNKTRRASQDQGRTSSEAARSSQERSSQDFVAHKGHVGTDGPIGDPSQVSGLQSGQEASRDVAPATEGTATTSAARDTGDEIQPAAPAGGVQTLAPGERAPEGYITLTRADSAPDDPHVIVG